MSNLAHPTVLAAAGSGALALDLLTILACAGIVAIVLGRLKVSVIPGYVLAGVLVGPNVLGLVGAEGAGAIARPALVMLLFAVGLHMDAGHLRRRGEPLLAIGAATTLASAFALFPLGVGFGLPWPAALVAAMAFSTSSTAAVLRALQSRRELHRVGRLSFALLLIQDVVVVAYLAALPALASLGPGNDAGWPELVGGIAMRIAATAAMLALGRLLLPKLIAEAVRSGGAEVSPLVAGAAALAAIAAFAFFGFPMEVGAFLAGFLLAATPFRYQVSGPLVSARDLLTAVFYTSLGVGLHLSVIAGAWWGVLLASLAVLIVKAVVITAASWASGVPAHAAARSGLTLAHGGEFSLVILAAAAERHGLLAADLHALLVGVVAISLMTTPALVDAAPRLSSRLRGLPPPPWIRRSAFAAPPEDEPAPPPKPEPRELHRPVIVAGYGPVGRAVAECVERSGSPVTIIELNPDTVRRQSELGRSIVLGNACSQDALDLAGIHQAGAVVLTIPDEEATLEAVKLIRSIRPDIFIGARAGVLSKALLARQAGADHVTVEEMATAELMSQQVIAELLKREAGER